MAEVVVAGSSGLLGRAMLRELAKHPGVTAVGLVRRPGVLPADTGAREVVFDYDAPASYQRLGTQIPCDVLLCCLGTTMKTAGSPQAFLKVDREYPLALIARAAALPRPPVFGLVSSVGADHARGVYLGAKAAVERALRESGLAAVIVRPSLLDGDRSEFRAAERVGLAVGRPLFALLAAATGRAEWVGRFAPVAVSTVAAALVRETLRMSSARTIAGDTAPPPLVVQEGWELRSAAET